MSCGCNYIALFRGDDSDFLSQQKVELAFVTDLDLTGCSAHFALLGYQQNFAPIEGGARYPMRFPRSETAAFPIGLANGRLWLEDSEGRVRTVANAIHFLVTNKIAEAYPPGDDSTKTITVTITAPGFPTSYDDLSAKPTINGVTLAGNLASAEIKILTGADRLDVAASDWETRTSVASLWRKFGGTVVGDDSSPLSAQAQAKLGAGASSLSPHSYNSLTDKPQINGITLMGDMVTADLKILTAADRLDLMSSDWDFRMAVASLWLKLGGSVVNQEDA